MWAIIGVFSTYNAYTSGKVEMYSNYEVRVNRDQKG